MNYLYVNQNQFCLLQKDELILIDGGAEEDRKFGELVGNAFIGALVECLPKIPFVSNSVRSNVRKNIIDWYLGDTDEKYKEA